MGALLQTEVLWGEVRRHWISVLFVLVTLVTILLLAALRWYLKRRWKQLIEERLDDEHELDLLPPVSSKDREALKLVKRLRRQVWELPEVELRLGVEALSLYAVRIVRSVAAVYHEQAAIPEYEASLIESLQLVRRVTARLIRLASLSPFRFLGEQKLSDYQRFYQVYKKINENPLLQMLKQHRRLYRVARWAMDLKNIGNPLYWAGKELSREGYFFMLRWFYLAFVSQVGREAMQLYSGRHFQREEDRDAVLICYRLFALTKQWSGPLPDDWSTLVDFVSSQSSLESESRLDILARCARGRFPKDLENQVVQTESGKKWYRQGLKALCRKTPELALRSEVIQGELEKLDNEVNGEQPAVRSKFGRLRRAESKEDA